MARAHKYVDVSNAFNPPEVPRGTPFKCEICGDPLSYQDRLAGMSACPRCSGALSDIGFCECLDPDEKRMIVPDCSDDEPFFRCRRCGKLI